MDDFDAFIFNDASADNLQRLRTVNSIQVMLGDAHNLYPFTAFKQFFRVLQKGFRFGFFALRARNQFFRAFLFEGKIQREQCQNAEQRPAVPGQAVRVCLQDVETKQTEHKNRKSDDHGHGTPPDL